MTTADSLARAAAALERIADILERWDRDVVSPPPSEPSGSVVVPLLRPADLVPQGGPKGAA